MNSLPPELLSSIVEQAAQCDSSYSSYKLRIRTLSALSLVNRTFRQLAQPLLPQKVWFRNESELARFKRIGKIKKVGSLKYESERFEVSSPELRGFLFMTELRVSQVNDFDIMALDGYQQLKRLCLEEVSLHFGIDFEHFALPNVEEVSFEVVRLIITNTAASRTTIRFFAPSRFPSLRALGIRSLDCFDLIGGNDRYDPVSIDYSCISQLDCIILHEYDHQFWIRSRQISPGSSLSSSFSVPLLFDVGSTTLPSFPDTPAYTNAHVRLRRSYESITNRPQNEEVLSFVQDLLTRSTVLAVVYLDLYSREGGTSGYPLEADLRQGIERVEALAEVKKVEIVWENHRNDWCNSRVSGEFWRRCKEKKEKARENESSSRKRAAFHKRVLLSSYQVPPFCYDESMYCTSRTLRCPRQRA